MNYIKITLLIVLYFLGNPMKAQQPEPIRSFATELHPVKWYSEQVNLWKNEIAKNKNNAFAWYSYYRATRCLSRLDTTDNRTYEEKGAAEKKIVAEMKEAVPESFEYNLCQWMIGGNSPEHLPYLKKAAALGPDREEIISEMINRGEIERDIALRDKYAAKWFGSNVASAGLLNYNYNVLCGLKQNAIIFTVGDNDTYPIWQLQSQGIRKDVTVINLYLIFIDSYRDQLFKELNIPKWDTSMHKKTEPHETYYQTDIMQHICKYAGKSPVYAALTCDPEFIKTLEDDLYLTGLAYEYSAVDIDNIALLKKNFEQTYALDYIENAFYHDISAHYTQCVNENYIVPMLKLYEHYKASGDLQRQEWMKKKLLILARTSDEEATILKHLK